MSFLLYYSMFWRSGWCVIYDPVLIEKQQKTHVLPNTHWDQPSEITTGTADPPTHENNSFMLYCSSYDQTQGHPVQRFSFLWNPTGSTWALSQIRVSTRTSVATALLGLTNIIDDCFIALIFWLWKHWFRVTISPLVPGHVLFLDLKNVSGRVCVFVLKLCCLDINV